MSERARIVVGGVFSLKDAQWMAGREVSRGNGDGMARDDIHLEMETWINIKLVSTILHGININEEG